MKTQIVNKLEDQSTVPIDIYLGNGARLSDKAAVEDYHANSIVSHQHRMSFKMRKPPRVYEMMKDGLAPVKVYSKHIFARSELPPSFDLATVRQLEDVWYAALTGVVKEDDLERKANVWTRVGAVLGAIAIVLAALFVRSRTGGDEAQPVVVGLLTGGWWL